MRWPLSDYELSHRWANPLFTLVALVIAGAININVHWLGNTLGLPFLVAFFYFWRRWDHVRAARKQALPSGS